MDGDFRRDARFTRDRLDVSRDGGIRQTGFNFGRGCAESGERHDGDVGLGGSVHSLVVCEERTIG
ncbi:hypothetical protein SDC9_104159 [bioreactor metagenome]|uniref:Uncharacterized protein n=1 Tax=bioreactor metagenome TaxID=1076179 RepID=A0A645AW11_9ZZZZ